MLTHSPLQSVNPCTQATCESPSTVTIPRSVGIVPSINPIPSPAVPAPASRCGTLVQAALHMTLRFVKTVKTVPASLSVCALRGVSNGSTGR